MINIPKDEILAVIEFNPSMLIGKTIISKNISGSPLKIIDVNLKCTHILIEEPINRTHKWTNVNDLDDNVVFDSFERQDGSQITIRTLSAWLTGVPNK
jgi:hypothetical protein